MTVSQILERLDRAEREIREGLRDVLTVQGGSMCGKIADRVIETGRDGEGQAFSPYSTQPVPAFFYFERSLNQRGESAVRKAAKQRTGLSYRDFRDANNRPTDHKNFSFSQEMWRGFGLKSVQPDGSGAWSLVIGGKTPTSAQRIEWNSEREGRSIVAPDAQELAELKANIVAHLQRTLTT